MEASGDLTPDDTNVPDIHSGALDVAGHVLGSLGVQVLSGIKGLSTLPSGTDAAAQAVRDYQDKYSPGELSPEGISTIRDTVAPIYRGVQDTFHTKQLGDAYNQGAQSFSNLAGKYLGPEAAGVAGAMADVAPMAITPEGLLGKGVADTAKLVPKALTPLLDDGAHAGTLAREAAANARRAEDGLPVGEVPPSEFQGRQAEHEGAVAQRMAPSRQISAVPAPESHLAGTIPDTATVYTATHPETGEMQGYAVTVPRGDAHQITDLNVDPAYRRQGVGRDLFNSAVAGAHGDELPLHSDTSVTPEQLANVQHSGHSVVFNPHIEEGDGPYGPALLSRNGQPVYTIPPPAAANDALVDEPEQGSWIASQAHAEGGEVGPALGDIGKLVDKFAPLTKQIQETGGVTYHPGTGTQPTSGYAVSLHKGREQVLPQAPTNMDLAKYTYANRDAFESDPGAHVGVWHDPASGQHFMDVSHVDPDFNSALQKAKANAQLGIFDLGRGETVPTADDTLHFLHMSNLSAPDVTLDPAYYGTGIKGAEAKRGGTKVTSLYPTDVGQVEQGLESKTPYRVSVPASSMYNANEDPLALKDANRLPGGALDMNGYEDAIRDAGYAGYHVPDAEGILRGQGRLFGPTPATRLGPGPVAEPEEDLSFAEGGDVAPVLGDLGSLVAKYAPELPLSHDIQPANPVYRGADPAPSEPTGTWYQDATNPQQQKLYQYSPTGTTFDDLAIAPMSDDSHVVAQSCYNDYELAPGIRNVPLDDLGLEAARTSDRMYGSGTEHARITALGQAIKNNGKISPLHVGIDENGNAELLEGQHRARALRDLGYDSVPARIIVDMTNKFSRGGSVRRFADGGEAGAALGDLGSLVAHYAPEAEHLSDVVGDTGGVTYNPTTGDVHNSGYAVPTNPARSAALDHAPSADDIHNFLLTHQDAFDADPNAALHVESDDRGNHFMHVATVTPDFGHASDIAAQHGLPGFQDLQSKEIFPANHPAVPEAADTSAEGPEPDLVSKYLAGPSRTPVPYTPGQQTVANPKRNAFPGVYADPRQAVSEATQKVGPEDPLLQQLFGVSRQDLSDLALSRQGNELGALPGATANPRGSQAAQDVMTPQNEQRLIDILSESRNSPSLYQGMTGWYAMDPLYERFRQIFGDDEAPSRYQKFNTLMGMASPGSDVGTEVARGTAAHWLDNQGRFQDFVKYGGGLEAGAGDRPADMLDIPGHAYHRTAQGVPMADYLRTGSIQMKSPKVPPYIQASGVPQTGFQTDLPVGDAHFARGIGLPDTRGALTAFGEPKVPAASVSTPEMQTLAPWWKNRVAGPAGLESVPAQALMWGAYSPATGVQSAIGAPKLEILSTQIGKLAQRLGVSPEAARDMVIRGDAGAFADGGVVQGVLDAGGI